MATLSSFKQQNAYKIGISSMLTEEQQKSAITKAAAEEEEKKNQGGFLGGIGYSLEKISLGFLSGIEGIWDYAAGGLAKLFGADDWAEHQIANDWVNYNHADEWFNPSEGWQFVGDVAGGIGTSVPAIAGVAAGAAIAYFSGGTLTPVAASLIAGSIAGLGAAGRATKEAYDQTGELTGKEFGYGVFVGVTEGAIEGVSSAIGAGTGAVVKSISKSFGKEVAKSATRNTLLKGVVKGFAGEAFEEGVQAILEPVYKRMTYDPNAKNATFQEVAYAALVGGLSGAIMGGGDVAVRNIRGTTRGNTLVNEGKAGDVITTAEQISSYQTENQTDYETFQVVQNTLDELKTSLQKTGGEVRTVRQKMLLGVLEQANISAAFEPIVTASAENIYNNAETVAARLNELGYQDQDGKPIQITAEQIREGIDTTDAKSFRKTMSRALKTNSALRTLAVADTVGQISMDTARFRDAALSEQSSKLITQADLNRFVEQATDAERQAVADRLGIENWETLTNEQFHDKIIEFVANGGVQEYQQERGYVKEAQAVAPEAARKHLPRMVNLRNDGTYRYTQGGTDIAITKRGDSYYVYDYESGLMSKALSRTETNRVLREIHTNEQNYQNGVRQHTEAQNRLREQAAEIDTYARENISEYKNLSAAGQAAIRATIRQGRAAGVQEDFVLSCARVSARSGLRVVFSKEASFVAANGSYADGAIDLKNNRIIINPEAKSRSGESILIHELTHAIYNDTDGTLTVAEGLETMTDAEKEKIRKRYAAVGRGSALEVSDEINAHFAEQTLSNRNILERLVQKKQTLKEKILGFFKKARTDYQSDEKLTGAAARLYRQYKKLFDEFSTRNQRYLGVENASEQAGTTQMQQSLDEYVAFRSNQIKLITNERPSVSRDIRYALPDIEQSENIRYALPDERTLKALESGETITVYRAMQVIDGKLYPPMAARVKNADGSRELVMSSELGRWEQADERPELIRNGNKFTLDKANGSSIEAAYNPYFHTSRSPLNDQFSSAYKRDNLVIVEGEVPASELTSGYRAQYAKDSVGEMKWHSGPVSSKLPKGKERRVILSRWFKPTRIVPDAEVAQTIADMLNGENIEVPYNTVTPSLLKELEKRGVSIKYNDSSARYALPETDSTGASLSQEQRKFFKNSKIVDEDGHLLRVYHRSMSEHTVFDKSKIGSGTDIGVFGRGFYFSSEDFISYGTRRYECYLNIRNPYVINGSTQAFKFKQRMSELAGKDVFNDNLTAADSEMLTQELKNEGYDGVVYWDTFGAHEFVAFEPEQIKYAFNQSPTNNADIRYALDSSEDGNAQPRGNYSRQRARFAANNTGMRVYTKAEAAEVINSIIEERLVFEDIGMYGELRGKDRRAVIDYLFRKLNTVKEGYRGGVALRIADYMIEHTVLTDMYAESNGEVSEAMRKLSVLRRYMHKINLHHIQGEIRYRFDRKNSINLIWGAKEGGIAPDTLPQLLAEEGIFLDAINEADCFLQMVDMYEDARAAVNNATEQVMLSTYGDARTIKNLRKQIARDVLNAYEQKGRKSKYAKLVEKYTKQIAELKQRLREANANNRLINSIVDQAQKMRDLKLGTFQNATQYDTEIFRSSIEKLGKIKFRGNFNIAGTRKIMADLRTWYTKDNPLLADSYEQGIADMLDEVANGKTNNYTKRELQSIRNIMAYFTNYVEHFNKVYRQGRWVDAVPEATRHIDILHRNEELKSSWFMRKVGTSYLQTFGDPMSVMRRMDRYESGFYTEIFTELRDSKIDAEVAKMQLMEEYEAFLKKNKKYLSQATKETVQYRGVEIPRMQLISLYMTLKRQHAQAGLAENGFGFWNAQDQRVRVDGFAKGITEESELRAAAVDEQARIAELLTETDKEYIAILEKGYQEAGRLKAERDIQRLGFTNATEDYYYPIRRGNIAKNVDSAEMQQELDRISNASFNKDTVRGAKQELFIESADAVFNRHVRGVVQYAYISPAIETYNKLYNLDIAGTPNKPVSVSTESANVWKQGNDYFKKLITDIQGIFPVSSEGRAVLSFIRGSYAKFQLGANPKVWVTQLSSLFASSSLLDASSITRGMTVSAKDVDTYCPLAKLRAQDNTAAMAQGVLDKVDRISNVLMAPIGKMDRFVVRRLFGACQVQVQKDGGAKIGTEANKIEAGKLLKRVILETQQNSLATERSAAMRSGNEIMRTLTMFSADSMKVIGRVIDSVGELSALKARLRTTTDAESRSTLQTQIKTARRNVRKSLTALATSALFMVAIAQLFNWLYNKDKDDDETAAQQVLVDFAGNLLGGLPLVRDIYSRIAEGYSVDNYAYSALNDLLDSAVNLFDTVGSLVSGDESNSKLTARTKNLLYALGQLTGIPTRNLYNVFYGLTKRISPTTAYKIDEAFYAKNYVTDLNKAIESDDTDMISMLTSMIFGERMGNTTMGDAVRNKFVDLYSKGYSVLPRSIGDTITYGGVEIPLTDEEYSRFRAIYAQSMKDIEKMVNSGTFSVLSEEMQAKAIKQVYDAYYYDALSDLVGVDERTTVGELSEWIDMSRLSVAFAGLSDIESDKNSKGETIAGSKKKNTVRYLLGQTLSDGERLLILCYRGYSIQDGDYKGYTAKRAKRILLQYILKLNGTQAEKAALAEKCGFTVRNGRIIRDF